MLSALVRNFETTSVNMPPEPHTAITGSTPVSSNQKDDFRKIALNLLESKPFACDSRESCTS